MCTEGHHRGTTEKTKISGGSVSPPSSRLSLLCVRVGKLSLLSLPLKSGNEHRTTGLETVHQSKSTFLRPLLHQNKDQCCYRDVLFPPYLFSPVESQTVVVVLTGVPDPMENQGTTRDHNVCPVPCIIGGYLQPLYLRTHLFADSLVLGLFRE